MRHLIISNFTLVNLPREVGCMMGLQENGKWIRTVEDFCQMMPGHSNTHWEYFLGSDGINALRVPEGFKLLACTVKAVGLDSESEKFILTKHYNSNSVLH